MPGGPAGRLYVPGLRERSLKDCRTANLDRDDKQLALARLPSDHRQAFDVSKVCVIRGQRHVVLNTDRGNPDIILRDQSSRALEADSRLAVHLGRRGVGGKHATPIDEGFHRRKIFNRALRVQCAVSQFADHGDGQAHSA